ncbi:MAG TPA: ester cyclase [Ktedonobacteraceae bacterium]|nr:ester cyclase [Ktedonobacteraceae bacterium]
MSTEDNKALVNRYFHAAWNQGNPAVIDELFAATFQAHNPAVPNGGSREGFKQFNSVFRSAFPNLRISQDDVIAEGDQVVTRFTVHGTHQGELQGIPPTGKQMTITGIEIVRVSGGKIVEAWSEFDQLGMLQQLGVIPAPGQTS